MAKHYDIIIVGGGLVGCCLAQALKKLPLRIGIIEAREFKPLNSAADSRAIALTYGSQCYLQQLELWDSLGAVASPINQVHVSDRGHFGITRFSASEMQLPVLGYVVPVNNLQEQFQTALMQNPQIEMIAPAKVIAMQKINHDWQLTVETPAGALEIFTALLIAADGGNSTIRTLQNIPVTEKDYQQTAIVAHIDLKRDHGGIAYERFTAEGALALLPYGQARAAFVWTLPHQRAAELLRLDEKTFLKHLQIEFGYRAGRLLQMRQRHTYPLKMLHAQPPANSDIILIGNAAHTLHPIAAQGLNLGVRDVAALAKLIEQKTSAGQSLNAHEITAAFLKLRQADYQRTIYFSDSLTRIFANHFLPLTCARNIGLAGFNWLPMLKRKFVSAALGIIK